MKNCEILDRIICLEKIFIAGRITEGLTEIRSKGTEKDKEFDRE